MLQTVSSYEARGRQKLSSFNHVIRGLLAVSSGPVVCQQLTQEVSEIIISYQLTARSGNGAVNLPNLSLRCALAQP